MQKEHPIIQEVYGAKKDSRKADELIEAVFRLYGQRRPNAFPESVRTRTMSTA